MPFAPRGRCRNPDCVDGSRCRDARHRDGRNHFGIPRQERGLGADFERLVPQVLERDGGRCQLRLEGCTSVATTGDHVIPRSRGGVTVLDNLRASCDHCNSARGARPLAAIAR